MAEKETLRDPEIEVIQLKADGYRNSEIATILKCSEATVDGYLNKARKRLDLNTPYQLVAYCLRQSIID